MVHLDNSDNDNEGGGRRMIPMIQSFELYHRHVYLRPPPPHRLLITPAVVVKQIHHNKHHPPHESQQHLPTNRNHHHHHQKRNKQQRVNKSNKNPAYTAPIHSSLSTSISTLSLNPPTNQNRPDKPKNCYCGLNDCMKMDIMKVDQIQ